MEPTKRPWELYPGRTTNRLYGIQECFYICGPAHESHFVADLFVGKYEKGTQDAELIVRAVNAHDDLLAACETALDQLLRPRNPEDAIAELRDVLRKAKVNHAKHRIRSRRMRQAAMPPPGGAAIHRHVAVPKALGRRMLEK